MLKRLPIVPLTLSLLAAAPAHSQYQLPPAPLQAIVDAPRAPALSLSPKRNLAAMIATPALPSIVEVAQPELKLAGLRINPRTYSPSRFSFGTDLTLLDMHTQAEMKVTGLPKPLRLADSAWSPDQRHLAFTHVAYSDKAGASAVELWLVDVNTRVAKKLTSQPLSYVGGAGFTWLPDASGLLVNLKPAALGKAPQATGIPSGPSTQDSQQGGARQLRTYPDLLKNEEDAKLFEHYATVQLALVDLAGKTRTVGSPDLFIGARLAPGGKYILTQALQRPFSYVVPASGFARRIDVRDLSGKTVHLVANKPLEEGLPPGNDAVPAGVRDVSWRIDAPATLVWAEAQDGGDPAKPAEIRDIVYAQAAPFATASSGAAETWRCCRKPGTRRARSRPGASRRTSRPPRLSWCSRTPPKTATTIRGVQ
jgi:dipeptidyl aminopeptidase/acylaminoacyl peptidase